MPSPTIYDGLCLYHKFDGLGSTLADSSGYRLDGTLTDATTVPGGKIGRALRASTPAGRMTIPHARCVAPLPLVSLSLWVYLDVAPAAMSAPPLFVDKLDGASGYAFGALTAGSNELSFRVHNAAATPYTATYTETVTGQWIHYACVYSPTTVKIYRNGIEVASVAADGTGLQNTTDLKVGTGLEGMLDELSIWRRSLDLTEVQQLYASGDGLELIQPELSQGTDAITSDFPEPYIDIDNTLGALPANAAGGSVPYGPSVQSGVAFQMSSIPDPYAVIEKTKRIYSDPNPNIVSVVVDSNYDVTAVGNGGPTDALDVVTWWQIDLGPNEVFVIASRESNTGFQVNRNQTDTFRVPSGQNWQGLQLTFWMQSSEDANQMWGSAPVQMLEDEWDHSGSAGAAYPTVIDGLSELLKAVNSWTTTLVEDINAATSVIQVQSIEGLYPAGGVLSIGDEIVKYRSFNTEGNYPVLLGCVRGFDDTIASPHGSGARVEARIVAAHHNKSVAAIRAIQGAIGTNPAADVLTGKTFANLQDRLASNLPLSVSKPLTRDWSFTHTRGRVVAAQLWALQDDGSYERIIAPMVQKIEPNGESLVTIMLDNPQTGYILVN